MSYLNYISDEDLIEHVKGTIRTYGDTLRAFNLARFNSNIVDPIKLTLDSKIYSKSLEDIIIEEIARQRDKTNTNAVGYFHQNIFKYVRNCEVPAHGFDVIFTKSDGSKIYVELKNKHNTMNSSSSQKTYMKLSAKALAEPAAECCLVEIIAKRSQNIPWVISLDGERASNERIRRISIDKFYEIVTGQSNAFANLCRILPELLNRIISENDELGVEDDTVLVELRAMNPDLLKAIYHLAFSRYEGFENF